jgi:uncharacterized membrane protein
MPDSRERRPLDEAPPPASRRSAGRPRDGAWSDQAVDERLGRVLQAGVILAGTVVFLGALVYLWRHGHETVNYAQFHGEPEELRTLSGIVNSTLAGRARGIIQLGLLLLVATPIARVAFAGYAFARQRDWFYVAVSLFVLLFLIASLRGGSW